MGKINITITDSPNTTVKVNTTQDELYHWDNLEKQLLEASEAIDDVACDLNKDEGGSI